MTLCAPRAVPVARGVPRRRARAGERRQEGRAPPPQHGGGVTQRAHAIGVQALWRLGAQGNQGPRARAPAPPLPVPALRAPLAPSGVPPSVFERAGLLPLSVGRQLQGEGVVPADQGEHAQADHAAQGRAKGSGSQKVRAS